MTKIAFISDIHGNLQALQTVLQRIDQHDFDMILCLGDIVGYGANPKECLQLVREREIPCVLGTHDEYVTIYGMPGSQVERLRAEVQQVVAWTQSVLSMGELRWLAKLPRFLEAEEFTICHSSFVPKAWTYCMTEDTFALNFHYQDVGLAFCGHSHSPMIGFDQGDDAQPYVDFIQPQELPEVIDHKIMVNVGSVGQPRDMDPRACFVSYEVETRHLELVRVEYDIEGAQAAIREAGLPERFAARLGLGK